MGSNPSYTGGKSSAKSPSSGISPSSCGSAIVCEYRKMCKIDCWQTIISASGKIKSEKGKKKLIKGV